jgi:hypothetical protein
MTLVPHDPVDRALAALRAREPALRDPAGDDELALRLQLAHGGARAWRAATRRAALLAGALVTTGVLAAGVLGAGVLGAERVRAWLGLDIVAVARAPNGEPVAIRARTGREDLVLVPLAASDGAFDPALSRDAPAESVPTPDGGSLVLRFLRNGRALRAEYWRAEPDVRPPRPGDRLVVVRVARVALLAERCDGALRLRQRYDDGSEETIDLKPVPGMPRCFGDGETLIELPGG